MFRLKNSRESKALASAAAAALAALAIPLAAVTIPQVVRAKPPIVAQAVVPSAASLGPPSSGLAGAAEAGRHLFLMNCAHCHADDASGDEGPDLHDLHKSDAAIHQIVTNGIKGQMPSFGKKLHDPEIQALTAYLRTLD